MTEGTVTVGAFYKGVAAGDKVRQVHDPIMAAENTDLVTQGRVYWFYVGALAAGEYGITEQDDFSQFIIGAAQRAPSSTPKCKHCGSEIVHEPDWYIRQMVWNDDFFHTTECDESPSKKHEPAAS